MPNWDNRWKGSMNPSKAMLNYHSMNVSSQVREMVQSEAKAVCVDLKITVDKFNQDACAATCLRSLDKLADMPSKSDEEKLARKLARLQVAYICSNASALRQAISTEKAKKGAEIAANVLALVK